MKLREDFQKLYSLLQDVQKKHKACCRACWAADLHRQPFRSPPFIFRLKFSHWSCRNGFPRAIALFSGC